MVAVIGAGVIGAAVAYALAREGREVLLVDRAEPGIAGASYGNVGHIATELVEPLPSTSLLFGFWRELVALGGPLDISPARIPGMLPWIARFARAAYRQEEGTKHLAPLVKASRATLDAWLREIGRSDLLRANGHYEIYLGNGGIEKAKKHASGMERLGIPVEVAPAELVEAAAREKANASAEAVPRGASSASRGSATSNAKAPAATGLWFPETGHVADPLELVRAFVTAAVARGARVYRGNVRGLEVAGNGVNVSIAASDATLTPNAARPATPSPFAVEPAPTSLRVSSAVICTGAWSQPLLAPFSLKVPMLAARGYHVELPGQEPLVGAPILYSDEKVVVTPMSGRLRASTYMEFAPADAPPDPRKQRGLREKVRALGYDCPLEGPSWIGPRPVLPDYLPGIGRVPGGPKVYYAVGHQHIGLTFAAVTGDLVADLFAGRTPRHDIRAFDLERF